MDDYSERCFSAEMRPMFTLTGLCCCRNGMHETKILSGKPCSTAMWSSILLGGSGKPGKSHAFSAEPYGSATFTGSSGAKGSVLVSFWSVPSSG